MAKSPYPVRIIKPRPQYRSGLQGLPHPSWRQAVGGVPERDGRALPDAAAFWAALGL